MGSGPELCLRWHSYQSCLLTSMADMLEQNSMTDITLSAEGRIIQAHQVVLSSCSGYFKEVLQELTSHEHPIIVLPGEKFQDLETVIQFMYRGEVNITQQELPGLIKIAESLRVKGLAKLDPSRATGMLQQACEESLDEEISESLSSEVNNGYSYSFGEDEEAVEITEFTEDNDNDDNNCQSEDYTEEMDDLNYSSSGEADNSRTQTNGNRLAVRKTLLPVSCPVCSKVLSNAYNLKVHMSIHDNITHECHVCGHASKSRDALRKHLAYRHSIGLSGPVRPRLSSKRPRSEVITPDESTNPKIPNLSVNNNDD